MSNINTFLLENAALANKLSNELLSDHDLQSFFYFNSEGTVHLHTRNYKLIKINIETCDGIKSFKIRHSKKYPKVKKGIEKNVNGKSFYNFVKLLAHLIKYSNDDFQDKVASFAYKRDEDSGLLTSLRKTLIPN